MIVWSFFLQKESSSHGHKTWWTSWLYLEGFWTLLEVWGHFCTLSDFVRPLLDQFLGHHLKPIYTII